MIKIPYSKNWNNKLDSDFHTTIRLWNPSKYKQGQNYSATLNTKNHHVGIIEDVKKIYFKDMNDWITKLDAGLDSNSFKAMMRKMYEGKLENGEKIEDKPFAWILCRKHKKHLQ
jgi:hypothetical protein